MHISIIATDFDGTISRDERLAPEVGRAMRRLRETGRITVLVSGRPFEFLRHLQQGEQAFDLIVAENGAVLYNPQSDEARLPFGQVPSELLDTLGQAGVPLWQGAAIAGTILPYDDAVWVVSRELGLLVHVETNRNEVMVLPPGASKGAGLLNLLKSERLSPRNMLAFGDAENDHSLLQMAEVKVAVANAVPSLKEEADYVTPQSGPAGVATFCQRYLLDEQPFDFPVRGAHHFHLDTAGQVEVNAHDLVDRHLLIAGGSGSGKTWLASRLADELVQSGYQLLALDPAGDLRALRRHATCLCLGREEVPPISLVIELLTETDLSLVVDLSYVPTPEERVLYTAGLLRRVLDVRQTYGRPHWLLLDEAQDLLSGPDNPAQLPLRKTIRSPGTCLVTWQPSRMATKLLAQVEGILLTRHRLSRETACLSQLLAERGLEVPDLEEHLDELGEGQALAWGITPQPDTGLTPLKFSVGPQTFAQMEYLHRYLEEKVAPAQRFYFDQSKAPPAGNLSDLIARLANLDPDVIEFHFLRRDFSRWVRDVLQDKTLARWLERLHTTDLSGQALRAALLETLQKRHRVLERLL